MYLIFLWFLATFWSVHNFFWNILLDLHVFLNHPIAKIPRYHERIICQLTKGLSLDREKNSLSLFSFSEGTFRECWRTPVGPEERFKTDTAYLSAVTPASLTTCRSIFLAAALFFDIFQDLFFILRFPFAFRLLLFCLWREVKASRGSPFRLFSAGAINDTRFLLG